MGRDIEMARVRGAMSQAFERGEWIGMSDACVGPDGHAAIAWGIFAPTGRLATCGAEQLPRVGMASTDAEAAAALACAAELRRMGAHRALCLCDCLPAIDSLAGVAPPKAPGLDRKFWLGLAQGDYALEWAPRQALGPANDAARKALGLAPELKKRRAWGVWLAELGVG
jgi:hypothetical protein